MSENKLIYSSDGSGRNLVEDQKKKKKSYDELIPSQVCLKLRIEKKGRGGKAVTVIYDLPDNPPFFKKLLKELKNHCGTGGSQKDSHLEIQGDLRPKIKAFLEKKGFQVKGA